MGTDLLRRWGAPAVLVLAILLPYHRLVTGDGLVITDDGFTSDIANGELPPRVETARMVRQGQLPLWLSDSCTGVPGLASGAGTDPLSLGLFAMLPPLAAINTLLLFLLVLCAVGTYGYARAIGATRAGGVLAGLAFAYSGFVVCQLKHLGAVTTVAWFPLGMLLLERALTPSALPSRWSDPRRARWLAALALVYGLQVLAGFPQTAYICGLIYGAYAALRVLPQVGERGPGPVVAALGLAALALLLGAALGAPHLLTLAEMGNLSDRSGGVDWEYASAYPYWPKMALTFLVPYAHGDISDLSYRGGGLFWENYGYVGLLPFLLAIGVVIRRFRAPFVGALALMTVVAYLVVLGPNTPVYRFLFDFLPGMANFRFPTRFLFVVDFGLAVLGGLGLTALQGWTSERWPGARRHAALWAALVVTVTLADLVHHQMRQNAIVDAEAFMATPHTVDQIRAVGDGSRVYSPTASEDHMEVFRRSRGWADDLSGYVELREGLQPNLNLLWDVPSVDCYSGVLPRYQGAVFGDHNQPGFIHRAAGRTARGLEGTPVFTRILAMFHVGFVVSPHPIVAPGIRRLPRCAGPACAYRVDPVLPRARVVPRARWVESDEEAVARFFEASFDPAEEVVLHGPKPPGLEPATATLSGSARIVDETGSSLRVSASAPEGGYLVLADTFYPGFRAEVNGKEHPIVRANHSLRAVALPPGDHDVRFVYASPTTTLGFGIAGAGLCGVLTLLGMGLRASRAAADLR